MVIRLGMSLERRISLLCADGVIRTFFRPRVGWHKLSSNLVLLPTRVLPMKYYCPVCGYDQLDAPATNHKICPCCGTHFAYDDVGHTWADLREAWLLRGTPWFSVAIAPPPEWNPLRQLEHLRSPAFQSRH